MCCSMFVCREKERIVLYMVYKQLREIKSVTKTSSLELSKDKDSVVNYVTESQISRTVIF